MRQLSDSDLERVLLSGITCTHTNAKYWFEDEQVCVKTFAFLHDLSTTELNNHVKRFKDGNQLRADHQRKPEKQFDDSKARKDPEETRSCGFDECETPRALKGAKKTVPVAMPRKPSLRTIGVLPIPSSQVIKNFGSLNVNSVGISPSIMEKYETKSPDEFMDHIFHETKVKAIIKEALARDLDILALQETKLQEDSANVFDCLITEFGYKAYHVLRPYRLRNPMRALAVLVKKDMRVIDVSSENKPKTFDCQVLLLNESVLFLNVYNPPPAPTKFYEDFFHYIKFVTKRYDAYRLLVCGDFNCPGKIKGTVDGKLEVQIEDLKLLQHVKEPTRQDSLLDLVLSYDATLVGKVGVVGVEWSDHDLVLGTLRFSQDRIAHRKSAMAAEL